MQTEALFWAGKAKFDSRIGEVRGGERWGEKKRIRGRKGDRWRVYDEDKRGLEEKGEWAVVVGCRDGRRRCFLPLARVGERSQPPAGPG